MRRPQRFSKPLGFESIYLQQLTKYKQVKIKLLISIFIVGINCLNAQTEIKVKSKYGSENVEIQNLYDFENIFVQKFYFKGEKLKGKSYIIKLQEFTKGQKTESTTLFDGTESDYFKIKSNEITLKFNLKLDDKKLKIQIATDKFRSKKSYFKLKDDSNKYVLKDFFGSNSEITIDINKSNPILALITPYINKSGFGSYCDVANSKVSPYEYGKYFKIPHYFLINIEFK